MTEAVIAVAIVLSMAILLGTVFYWAGQVMAKLDRILRLLCRIRAEQGEARKWAEDKRGE